MDNAVRLEGRWVYTTNSFKKRRIYTCSRCRKNRQIASNYCPNCGAKMKNPKRSYEE